MDPAGSQRAARVGDERFLVVSDPRPIVAIMGSVTAYETTAGRRYRVRYRKPDHSQTGERGFRTKREAELFLASTELSKAQGSYLDPAEARITVGELGADWLANKKQALKPSSYSPLSTAWRVYVAPRWGATSIGSIRPSMVDQWVRELGQGKAPTVRTRSGHSDKTRSPSVVIRAVGILAGVLDMAVRDGRLARNRARGLSNLSRKVTKKQRRYITDEEAFSFAEAVPDEMRSPLILTLAYTGIRWGEAVALRCSDIDVDRHRIRVRETATEVEGYIHVGSPKSWEARSVPFPEFLDSALARLSSGRPTDALVFAGPLNGYLMRPDTSERRQSLWLTALRDAHIPPLTPHDLKHTAASLAVSAGANVKALQRMLGHKSAAMTLDTYADLFDDDLDDVAERLNHRVMQKGVGKVWAETRTSEKKPRKSHADPEFL